MNSLAPVSTRDIIETLEEEVRQLRAMLGLEMARERRLQLKRLFRLTPSEAVLLGVLLNTRIMSKEIAVHALTPAGSDDYPEEKIVDVYVCKLRKRLRPHGLVIVTEWAEGYCLPDATREGIDGLLRGAQ